MKKSVKVIVSFILLFNVLSLEVYAEDLDIYLEILKENIPTQVKDSFSDLSIGSELPDLNDIFSFLGKEIGAGSIRPLRMLCTIVSIIIVSAVYHSFSGLLKRKGTRNLFDSLCSLTISLMLLDVSFESIEIAYDFINKLSSFSLSLFPVLSSVCILSGNINEATVSSGAVVLFVGICEKIMCAVLIPILKLIFAVSICSSYNSEMFDLSGITKMLKNIYSTVIGFIMMLFLAVLSYQNIIANAADNIAVRTVRFTAGSAIPIVGASVGEALKTVGGSLSLLKSTIGGAGVSVIIFLLLPCIVSLTIDRITLSAGAAISRILGCKKESMLLESALSVYGYTTSLVCVVSIMMIFILSVFASSASSLGGG